MRPSRLNFKNEFPLKNWLVLMELKLKYNIDYIRKDCFQVKSNLLTVDNLVFHF